MRSGARIFARAALTGAAALAFLLALPPSAVAQEGRERETMIDERFPVREGDALFVDVGDADVEVTTSETDELRVEVVLSARRLDDDARAYYERQNLSVEQAAGVVRVQSRPARLRFGWRAGWNHVGIAVRVSAPETFDASIRTSDGGISLTRLRGDVSLHTSDGDITVEAVEGAILSLVTSDGSIRADSLRGETIEVRTSDGDLSLGSMVADRATVRSSDGDVRIGELAGAAEVRTSDGDIEIEAARGLSFVAQTSDGSVRVGDLAAETASARSSDGDIALGRVTGALTARSSDGDISIGLPAGRGAELALHGERASVSGDLRISGEIGREHVEGTINGGGPRIVASTSDGSVSVRTASP